MDDVFGFKDFESAVWFGFLLPAGTPPDVVAKVQAATHAALDQPDIQSLFRAQGIEVVKSTPDEFAEIKRQALARGFRHCESGPLVRSSYHAHEHVPR